MIDEEIQLALDEKQDEILTGMPVPRDGKVGDIRTNIFHGGKAYSMMKVGIGENAWRYSAPYTRIPSIHTMDDYLLKSGGTMLDDRRIYFRDTGLSIYSSADGQLDIDADTELEITAPTVDINASTEVNISNNLTVGGDILLSNGNYIGISAAERLEFYTAGYAAFMGCSVGFGTATPGTEVDIEAATARATIESTTGTNFCYWKCVNTGGTVYFGQERSTGGALITGTAAYAGIMGHGGNYPLQFATNDAVRMTILGDGKVGILVADPHSALEVAGAISSATATITGNTANLDVSGINVLFVNPGAATTITGFTNGVVGQVLFISALSNGQDITMAHNSGTQKVFLHQGADETLSTEYGGWTITCDGTHWYDTEHSKHV